jgi:hypothetical protein
VLAAAILLVPSGAMAAFQSSEATSFNPGTATLDSPADVSYRTS